MRRLVLAVLILLLLPVHLLSQGRILSPEEIKFDHNELPRLSPSDILILYSGYIVNYNYSMLIPNWVSYELTEDEVVNNPPPFRGSFIQDPNISYTQSNGDDFKGSGWSRGHMAPAADFKWSKNAYNDTFYYTNCCPQNQEMNNGSWNVLENYVRKLAVRYGKVYIVTGPFTGFNKYGKIGNNGVAVPDGFFKALLVCKDETYYGIGFYMENIPQKQSLKDSFVSIADLELLTGIEFFPFLSRDKRHSSVKTSINPSIWF